VGSSTALLYRPWSGFWGSVASFGEWVSAGPLVHRRAGGTGVLLRDGRALVAGGGCCGADGDSVRWAETFDARTREWTAAGDLIHARYSPALVVLADGRVLAAGGLESGRSSTATAEIYDPATGRWTATGSMATARSEPLATLLADGRVLVAGGFTFEAGALASAEIYDPKTGTWSPTASMRSARGVPAATITNLHDERVLVTGGWADADGCPDGAEYFDPAHGVWRSAASMTMGRCFHSAVLTADGSVLVVGGVSDDGGAPLSSAEVYDPVADTWVRTADMVKARQAPLAVALLSGDVLVADGDAQKIGTDGVFPRLTAELFHPVAVSRR
jgi:hypothetical protein